MKGVRAPVDVFHVNLLGLNRSVFPASMSCEPEVHNLETLESSPLLSVSGLEVDFVAACDSHTPVYELSAVRNPDAEVFHRLWEFALQNWQPGGVYETQDDLLMSFFRTISCGAPKHAEAFITDKYLRYYCLSWFAPSRPGQILKVSGFQIPELGDHDEWNVDVAVKDRLIEPMQPNIDFGKLYAFTFAVTSSGRLALVPPWTQVGDRICVVYGCSSPLLLCKSSTKDCFEVRGEVCIGGFMFGEAVQAEKEGRFQKKIFHLA